MRQRKIFFRADAGQEIGYGHFIRSLALADMLREEFDCTFYTSSPSTYQIEEMEKVCNHISLNERTKFEDFINLLEGDEIVVLDNYFYTTDYQKQIKEKGCKLVCIDDIHDKHYVADVVINHGLTDASLFDIEPYTRLCLGFSYALIRPPFLHETHIKREYNSWFISFGGTDYLNLTEKAIKAIHDDPRVAVINVVVGDAYLYKLNLNNYSKVNIKKNLTAEQMALMMKQTQYAILPSSSVCLEAIACGCKVLACYYVDNQKCYHDEWNNKGFIFGLGKITDAFQLDMLDKFFKKQVFVQEDFSRIKSNIKNEFKLLLEQ